MHRRGAGARRGLRAGLLTLDELVERARSLLRSDRVLLGITGPPGAGKTTLAEHLVAALDAGHVPMDGFHLADVELDRLGLRSRKGAPETFDAAGYAALLARLRARPDEIVYAPGFERTLEQPLAGAVPVHPSSRLVVTEGNYLLLWPRVRALLDEVWYVDVDPSERVRRLVARHVEFGKAPHEAAEWVASVDEPNAALIEASRDLADLVVRLA